MTNGVVRVVVSYLIKSLRVAKVYPMALSLGTMVEMVSTDQGRLWRMMMAPG